MDMYSFLYVYIYIHLYRYTYVYMQLPSLLVILIRRTFSEGCMQGHPSVASARPCASISLRLYRQALLGFSPLFTQLAAYTSMIRTHLRRNPHPGGELSGYRVTTLIQNRLHLQPYSRPMPRSIWWS